MPTYEADCETMNSAYHCNGSLVVKADSEDDARVLFNEYLDSQGFPRLEDQESRVTKLAKEIVYAYPDSGCC